MRKKEREKKVIEGERIKINKKFLQEFSLRVLAQQQETCNVHRFSIKHWEGLLNVWVRTAVAGDSVLQDSLTGPY